MSRRSLAISDLAHRPGKSRITFTCPFTGAVASVDLPSEATSHEACDALLKLVPAIRSSSRKAAEEEQKRGQMTLGLDP